MINNETIVSMKSGLEGRNNKEFSRWAARYLDLSQ